MMQYVFQKKPKNKIQINWVPLLRRGGKFLQVWACLTCLIGWSRAEYLAWHNSQKWWMPQRQVSAKKAGCARKLAPFIIVSNFTIVVYLSRNLKFNCESFGQCKKLSPIRTKGIMHKFYFMNQTVSRVCMKAKFIMKMPFWVCKT